MKYKLKLDETDHKSIRIKSLEWVVESMVHEISKVDDHDLMNSVNLIIVEAMRAEKQAGADHG